MSDPMRLNYRELSAADKEAMKSIKVAGETFHEIVSGLGNSRELSLALTRIEEAVMWATKHVTAEKPDG